MDSQPTTNIGYNQRKQDLSTNAFYKQEPQQYCHTCETDLCPSHSNLHHLSPQYINKQLNFFQQNNRIILERNQLMNRNQLLNKNQLLNHKRISLSQDSLHDIQTNHNPLIYRADINNPVLKSSRNLIRLNRMRLSKSEDSLSEIQRNLREIKQHKLSYQPSKQSLNENILDYSSSDDEYITENTGNNQNFDTLSSKSCYSITTEANCDFEFFQNNDVDNMRKSSYSNDSNNINNNNFSDKYSYEIDDDKKSSNITKIEIKPQINLSRDNSMMDINHNLRITRSNSKRSLENFHYFVGEGNEDCKPECKIQRSNSYMTLEDRKRNCRNNKMLLRSNSKLSDCTQNIKQKIKSVEYLPSSNASTVYIEDICYFNLHNRKNGVNNNYVGSVPDLKKVFISEYI